MINNFMAYGLSTESGYNKRLHVTNELDGMKKKLTIHAKFLWSPPIHQSAPNHKKLCLGIKFYVSYFFYVKRYLYDERTSKVDSPSDPSPVEEQNDSKCQDAFFKETLIANIPN